MTIITDLGNTIPPNEVVRIGCAYCFWTINPEDPDERRRSAVRVGEIYYHTCCWDEHPNPEIVPIPATVQIPPPLTTYLREPVALHAGPLNTLNDLPLGISHSILQLQNIEMVEFTLRNNLEQAVTLERRIGPPWVAIEFKEYNECSAQLTLLPKTMLTVQVYPSFIRPAFMISEAKINERQYIDLESNTIPIAVVAVIVSFVGCWLVHIFSLYSAAQSIIQAGWSTSVSQVIISSLSMIVLISLTFFMAASWLLWNLYSLIDGVRGGFLGQSRFINRLLVVIQHNVWVQFAHKNIIQAMHNPKTGLLRSIVMGTIVGIICNLSALLILMLLSPILLLVWIIYAGFILWLLYRFLIHYNFNGVLFGLRTYRFLKSLVYRIIRNISK